MQQLSKLIFSSVREDRFLAGEIILANIDKFTKIPTVTPGEYKIFTFDDFPKDFVHDFFDGYLIDFQLPRNPQMGLLYLSRNKSIYFYPKKL